jgi:hypothetical protein
MSFNGTEGAPIALDKAASWTANYKVTIPSNGIKAHFFGKDILNQILSQEGCMGIRMYYAKDDDGVQQLILIGANAAEQDMINGTIADYSSPCPTACDASSPLF